MKNPIFNLILLSIKLCLAIAQPHYSRPMNEIGSRHVIYQPTVLPNDELMFSIIKYVNDPQDPDRNGIYSGWLRVNADWSVQDTFLYEKGIFPSYHHCAVTLGDTLFHSFLRHEDIDAKEFHIRGHNWRNKDSLFHWKFSLAHLSNSYNMRLMCTVLAPEGHLVAMGVYAKPRDSQFRSDTAHYFIFEISLDGEVIRFHDNLHQEVSLGLIDMVYPFYLLMDGEHYYINIAGWGNSNPLCGVVCIDRSDLQVRWRRMPPGLPAFYYMPSGLGFSRDSQHIHYGFSGGYGDFDWENMPYEEWPSWITTDLLVIDKYTGELIDEHKHSYLDKDSLLYKVVNGRSSRFDSDMILVGSIYDNRMEIHNDLNAKWEYGMAMRLNPEVGIKWQVKIIDEFEGDSTLYGSLIENIIEADNGDLILTGYGQNWTHRPYGEFAWVVRMGADGCAGQDYCSNDTMSMTLISTSTSDLGFRLERTVGLILSPNPSRPGDLVRIETATDESPDIIQELRIYDMQGRLVLQQNAHHMHGVLQENRLRIPEGLKAGVYQVEMIAGPLQRYTGKLVVME